MLAKEHEKPKSLTLALALVTYYFGSALGGLCFGAFVDFAIAPELLSASEKTWFSVTTLFVAFASVLGVYLYLYRRWTYAKSRTTHQRSILDDVNML